MKETIERAAAGATSPAASRGKAAALVAAASLVFGVLGIAQAPAASALTGTIGGLPPTSTASPWNMPFLAKVVPAQLTASGSATFTISPALPQGLSLTSTGLFSGSPQVLSAPTAYTITATSTDPLDTTPVTTTLNLAVVPSLVAPTGTIFGTAAQQLPAIYTVKAEGFTVPSYSFNPPLPWLSIDAKGLLSGIPPAAGSLTSTLTVSEAGITGGQTVSAVMNFSIAAAGTGTTSPPTTGSGLTPASQTATGIVGSVLTPALTAFPASATTTYTITPDVTVASGLTFTAATGLVSGTPTKAVASGTSFLIEQRNVTTNAVLASSTLALTVNASLGTATPIRASTGSSIGTVVPFSPAAAVAAGLGTGITFSVTPALPTGLALDPATGALSGVPAGSTSGDFTITATDGTGAKASGVVTITVGGTLSPAAQSITGTVGQNLTTQVMSITGMRAPITYSISPAVPGGLLFDSATGVLSGVPTVPILNGSFTITASDAAGARSTATLSLTVSQTLLSVPVIGTVTGGPQVGSLQVFFAPPTGAAAGTTYTVQVYDSTGNTLITTITTTSSPALVTGLVGGTTYSVIVMAGGLDGTSPVQSLPKTGTASSTATASTQTVNLASAGTVPFSLGSNSTSSVSALADFGLTVGTAAKTKKATKAFATKKPARKIKKSEKIHAPLDTFVSIVIPNVPVKGLIQVLVRVQKHNWVSAGFVQVDDSKQLTLPALSSSKAGTFPIKLKPPAGKAGHIKIVFDPPAKGSSDSSSSSSTASKKPSTSDSQSGF